MKIIKKIFTPFVISLILSVILHIILIAGVSDINGFDFFIPVPQTTFFANLVSEKPPAPDLSKSLKTSSPNNLLERKTADSALTDKEEVEAADNTDSMKDNVSVMSNESKTESAKTETAIQDNAQAGQQKSSPEPQKASREKLSYDIYWLGIFVGRATIEAVNDNGTVRITSRVHSSPFISTFYTVEDYAESVVVDGMPVNFRIKQREGKYRSDKETIFDMANKKITFMNYLKGTTDEHSFTNTVLWDVISGFYYLRTQFFDVGKIVYIDIFDSNKFIKAEVNVLNKEKITLSDNNEIDSIVVKPVLKSEGLFQSKGDILIWLTDDKNKIPVKIETKVPIGKVTARLKSIETGK